MILYELQPLPESPLLHLRGRQPGPSQITQNSLKVIITVVPSLKPEIRNRWKVDHFTEEGNKVEEFLESWRKKHFVTIGGADYKVDRQEEDGERTPAKYS